MNRSTPESRGLLRLPSVQSLLIQCASIVLALLFLQVVLMQADYVIDLGLFVAVQGIAAALLALWRRMAPWWVLINLLFLPALSATHALALPPSLFLAGFILLTGLYWTTFRTQVPLYLSGRAVWDSVERLLPAGSPVRFLDIGSGLGGLVLHLGRKRPDCRIAGIELAPLPWLIGWLRGQVTRCGSRFMCGDYDQLDFARYDVIFAYLSPAAMPALWEKAATEMRSGALLLSYEFPVAGVAADLEIRTEPGGRILYGWHMQGRCRDPGVG